MALSIRVETRPAIHLGAGAVDAQEVHSAVYNSKSGAQKVGSPTGSSCFATEPLPRHVLTASMPAAVRSSCVPYALGVSLMSVCKGTCFYQYFVFSCETIKGDLQPSTETPTATSLCNTHRYILAPPDA